MSDRTIRHALVMDDDALKAAIARAGNSESGVAARKRLCECLAAAFRATGTLLWTCGNLIGADRPNGRSPFNYGSDATVGLATVVQIAGELTGGATILLEGSNRYGAAALMRQVIEIEYLTWAFADAEEEAATWLRSSRQDRLSSWQPRHLRMRAGGRFRAPDYAYHCEEGGHPTPRSATLLPCHHGPPDFLLWADLANHGLSIWRHTMDGAEKLDYGEIVLQLPEVEALSLVAEHRQHEDPLVGLLAEARIRIRCQS
jgi:hypothetical protein